MDCVCQCRKNSGAYHISTFFNFIFCELNWPQLIFKAFKVASRKKTKEGDRKTLGLIWDTMTWGRSCVVMEALNWGGGILLE